MNTKASRDAALRPHRPLGATFYRYVAREAVRPTLFALLGLTAVILTKDLLGYSDLIINRGLGAHTVGALAFLQAVPIAALMFPFSVLLGSLVAMGRLGADHEILTLEASGIAAGRLVLPLIAFAAAMTALALPLSLEVSPWAYRSRDAMLDRITHEKPWSQMQKGEVADFGGWRVEAREVSNDGKRLKGVLMWMPDLGETVFSRTGSMESEATGSVRIHLRNGSALLSPREDPRMIRFDTMTTQLPDEDESSDSFERRPRWQSMTLAELREGGPTGRLAIEYYRRFALPAATLVFGLLAGPLILVRGSFSRASGGVLGIGLTLAYYALTQLGEGMIQSQRVTAAAGVWMPNAVLALLAIALLVRVARSNVLGIAFDRRGRGLRRASRDAAVRVYRSRRYPLPRYIAGRFLRLAAISFAVMMVAYLLINVMERLDWFARYGATGDEILRYYAARLPLFAARVIPMSLLVGTALTVSVLAAEGELIGMRSCGIPQPRALLPVFVSAAFMVPLYFALNDIVVPRTNAMAYEVKVNEIEAEAIRAYRASREGKVWYRAGDQVIVADRFDPDFGEASRLAIYRIDAEGQPVSRISASSARHIGGGEWRIHDARMVEVDGDRVRRVPAPRYTNLGEVLPAKVSTSQMSIAEISAEIAEMRADGYDVTSYEVDRYVKFAQPLACFILPALVLFFAAGGPPFPGPAQNLLVSIVVGVGYLLAAGVSASFGYGGVVSPVMGGWGPNVLFFLIAAYFGLRLWRRM